jgi:hypothetical protein
MGTPCEDLNSGIEETWPELQTSLDTQNRSLHEEIMDTMKDLYKEIANAKKDLHKEIVDRT